MFLRKRHPPVGSIPGTLMIPADATRPVIRVIDYAADHVEELEVADVASLAKYVERDSVTWVDVQGIGDETVIRAIGDLFALHPLALEDAVNVPQRPKSESYERFQLFITRMTRCDAGANVDIEQLSIFLGERFVLTLQEHAGDVLDPVRARIRSGLGPIQRAGADYLAYAIIDTVVDGYYPVLETLGDYLEDLEAETLEHARPVHLRRMYDVKRKLLELRRAIWPQREAINAMIRNEHPLVGAEVRMYLRDCHDHTVQVIDVVESYRELVGTLMDLYLSMMGQRTNDVMKVLTIVSTIFIPLTFVAGIYGMNFVHMPELQVRWAYPAVMGLMAATAAGMVVYFWRKGWLGGDDGEEP
jgi:magnesium transporter